MGGYLENYYGGVARKRCSLFQNYERRGKDMKGKIVLCLIFVVLLSGFSIQCWAEEGEPGSPEPGFFHDFRVHGFLRYEPSIHIAGRNWNNDPLQKDNNWLNLSRAWFQIEPEVKLGDFLKFYSKIRFISETAPNIDGDLYHFEALPLEFPRNGGMLQAGRKHGAAEVWELFMDLDIKPIDLWFRIGKQVVAWGEPIAIRVFDVVNSLDLRWHGFYEPSMDEFDNIRIPMWGLRAIQKIPTRSIGFEETSFEAFVSPTFFPQLMPALGSPYNMIPSFVEVHEREPNNWWVYAFRLNTLFKGVGLSLMYANKPVDAAVATLRGLKPDLEKGIPLLAGFGDFTPYVILNNGEHPRIHIFGASANYMINPLKLTIRGEMTYTPNMPYQKAPSAVEIEDRGTYNAVLILERNFKWTYGLDSLMANVQFNEVYFQGKSKTILINNVEPPKKNKENVALYLSQPIKQIGDKRLPLGGILTLDFLFLYDLDNAWWIQPGIRYDVGNHWRFNLYANIFDGNGDGDLPGRVGSLRSASEIFMRLTYGF
jgi:hypothetical protein